MSVKLEIIEKTSALITAAFGLIAALAWNSAIQNFFAPYQNTGGPWIYAIIITIIAVVLTIWIGRVAGKVKKQVEELEKRKAETKA